jgi:hypothetical protein
LPVVRQTSYPLPFDVLITTIITSSPLQVSAYNLNSTSSAPLSIALQSTRYSAYHRSCSPCCVIRLRPSRCHEAIRISLLKEQRLISHGAECGAPTLWCGNGGSRDGSDVVLDRAWILINDEKSCIARCRSCIQGLGRRRGIVTS